MSKKKHGSPEINFEQIGRAALEQAKQIPREKWVRDFQDILRRAPLTSEELHEFLLIIISRLPAKNCVRCQRLKADGVEGSVRNWRGYGNVFLCSSCQGILIEKNQLED